MALFLGVMDYLRTIRVSIFRRWLSDHFFCSVATLLQIQSAETNHGRRMSLFGLINCGPGPIGSFPFGLVAAAIGAPWTVAICGFITVGLIAYLTFSRSDLSTAKQ
jgi:hypothetical protein